MLRFLILFCFIFLENNAISFEMELNGKQENIFFVKKRNNNIKNYAPKKKTIVINKDGNKNKTTGVINRAVVAEKQGGKVVKVDQINRNKNMYVSADDMVIPKVDNNVKKTQSITINNKTNKISKNTNKKNSKVIVSAGNNDSKNNVKDLISNNKRQTYTKPVKPDIVNKLCDMAIKNDVVNFKKTLMGVNYDKDYVNASCGYGNTLLMISIVNDNYLTCKLLLENNADVNIVNDAKVSVLHTIVKQDGSNNDRMFKQLIGVKSINLDLQDIEGYTPIMRALLFEKFGYLKMLIEAGANIYVKNNYGEDILDLAKKQLKVVDDNKKKELEEVVKNIQEIKNNV